MALTDMQKLMYDAFRHKIKVKIAGENKFFIGRCCCYTKATDNEPEIASIDIDVGRNTSVIEIYEHQIESIEILD